MEQCTSKVKQNLIDHILTAADSINDKEQLLYVLKGLNTNYTSLVT